MLFFYLFKQCLVHPARSLPNSPADSADLTRIIYPSRRRCHGKTETHWVSAWLCDTTDYLWRNNRHLDKCMPVLLCLVKCFLRVLKQMKLYSKRSKWSFKFKVTVIIICQVLTFQIGMVVLFRIMKGCGQKIDAIEMTALWLQVYPLSWTRQILNTQPHQYLLEGHESPV